jgi:hypothetical protein
MMVARAAVQGRLVALLVLVISSAEAVEVRSFHAVAERRTS